MSWFNLVKSVIWLVVSISFLVLSVIGLSRDFQLMFFGTDADAAVMSVADDHILLRKEYYCREYEFSLLVPYSLNNYKHCIPAMVEVGDLRMKIRVKPSVLQGETVPVKYLDYNPKVAKHADAEYRWGGALIGSLLAVVCFFFSIKNIPRVREWFQKLRFNHRIGR